MLRLIYDRYKLRQKDNTLYNITNLFDVKWQGDSKIEKFLLDWDYVVHNMVEVPDAR